MSRALPYATPPDPRLQRPEPRGEWVLCDSVWIRDGVCAWTIPAGFRMDLASIPRAVRALMETSDLGIVAPVAHDFLYRRGGWATPHIRYSRGQADRLFADLMRWEGVPAWRRWAAYYGVRLGGWASWRNVPPPERARAA